MFPQQNRPAPNLPAGRVEGDRAALPQPLKVLVVEDSALDCDLVIHELRKAGFAPEWHRVETEVDYLAGLQSPPDLVLSDFRLPHFNGLRALELLKQSGRDIPFILVSGTIGEDTAVEAMRQGAADYLLKDRLARLGTAVARAVSEARLRHGRQQAEIAIRESNEKFNQLADNISDVFWIRSADMSEVQYVSPAFEKIWGRTVASLQANPHDWSDFIFAEDRARVVAAFGGLSVAGPSLDLEYRIVRPDGEIRWVRTRGSQVRNSAGPLIRHIGIVTDITDRKKVELVQSLSAAVLKSVSHGVIITTRDQLIISANAAFLTITGYAEAEVLGRNCRFLQGPDTNPRTLQEIRLALRADRAFDGEILNYRKSGTPFWNDLTITPVQDAQGISTHFVGITRDISERNRAAAELVESQHRLALATESAHIGIWDWNVAKNELVWDAQMYALYGIRGEEFSGAFDAWQKGLHPEDRARCETAFSAALAGPEGFHLEFRVVWPNGQVRVIEAHAEVTRATDGSPLHLIGVNRDVTERRRTENDLRQSEEKFRRLIEDSSDVIAVVNESGVIQYQSPSTLRILGYQPEEVLGHAVTSFIHPEDRGKAEQGIQRAFADGLLAAPVEYRIQHRDGTWRIFQSIGRLMSNSPGEKAVVVNSRDLTEARKLELQFLRTQRLEAIGTLSSGIAHDLNNILAPMLIIAPMLREKMPDTHDKELATIIEQGALRGANIIKQLLTFSRGVEGERGPVQAAHLLKEMVGIMRETFPRELSIHANIPTDLWPVHADATQIHQVLLNLCVNARDAMPAGGKLSVLAENVMLDETATELHPAAKPGPFVRLSIADKGEGISRENIDRIFEPFFTTKGVGKGTGLGLSTVIGIVKSHSGIVTVFSEPGLGTTFNIYLPAVAGTIAAVADTAPRPPAGHGELILVVDDEASIRRALSLALEKENYHVVVAADGHEAMALFQSNESSIRLLLTDLMMPGMNGMALIRLLRAKAPQLRVIAASGLHDDQRREELTALGVTGILAKPFRTEEVFAAVQRELQAGP